MNIAVKTPRDPKEGSAFPALPELKLRVRNGVVEFPVHHVRGGTSTGLVIFDRLAPSDLALKEELLRHLMGLPLTGTRPGNKQITGLGRIVPTGNKVFFAEIESANGKPRLVSTLAQLASDKSAIDWSVNCGNMSAALPVWALDTGLVERATGREEAAGLGADRAAQAQVDAREAAHDAGDLGLGRDARGAVGRADGRVGDDVGVGVEDADDRRADGRLEEAAVEGVHRQGGRHVAAVDAPVDRGLVGRELGQGAGDVGVGGRGAVDDEDLVAGRGSAAEAGGLAVARPLAAGRHAHDAANGFFAGAEVAREVLGPEHDAGRGAAAHVVDGQLRDAVDDSRGEAGDLLEHARASLCLLTDI